MAARVARHVEDLGPGVAEIVAVAVADLDIDAGDAVAVRARPDDGAAGLSLDLPVAPGVVAVMMGVEDMGDCPAAFRGLGQRRIGDRGVDDRGQVLCRLMRQPDIVVVENGNADDFQL